MLWTTCSTWSTRVTSVPDDLDDLSGIPRYLQAARAIEAEIRAGQWTPGNAVPSRNQLAERFGVARETAARQDWNPLGIRLVAEFARIQPAAPLNSGEFSYRRGLT